MIKLFNTLSKKIEEFSDKDHSQSENLEEYLDLDIRIGSSAEADHITNNQFLTRGLSEKPIIEESHCNSYSNSCCKLANYDWIENLNLSMVYKEYHIAEVRFKNSHKEFFILPEEGK